MEVHFVNISDFARKKLGIRDLWMFDGEEWVLFDDKTMAAYEAEIDALEI